MSNETPIYQHVRYADLCPKGSNWGTSLPVGTKTATREQLTLGYLSRMADTLDRLADLLDPEKQHAKTASECELYAQRAIRQKLEHIAIDTVRGRKHLPRTLSAEILFQLLDRTSAGEPKHVRWKAVLDLAKAWDAKAHPWDDFSWRLTHRNFLLNAGLLKEKEEEKSA